MAFCPTDLNAPRLIRRLTLLWIILKGRGLWCLLFLGSGPGTVLAAEQDPASPSIDSVAVLAQARHELEILCSDSLAGRGYQADGHRKTAHYLARRFREMGLQSFPDLKRPYLQPFNLRVHTSDTVFVKLGKRILKPGADYILYPGCASVRGQHETVYVGYGGPEAWPQDQSLRRKVAVVRSGKPLEALVGEADAWSDEAKIRRARQAGALGVILIQKKLTAAFSQQGRTLPVICVREDRRWKPDQIPKVEWLIRTDLQKTEAYNVVGWLKGTTCPDSFVVCTAHYDHLGRLSREAVFRGANDNGSGTAFLLALARALVKQPPRCSVLFIATGGEEVGLLGSLYYVTDPVVPLSRCRYVLNFDLMGNGEEGLMAVGGKTFEPLYQSILRQKDALGLPWALDARPNVPNSDHYPFTMHGIPGLFFYTRGGSPHYHDIYDVPSALQLPVFVPFLRLMTAFVREG